MSSALPATPITARPERKLVVLFTGPYALPDVFPPLVYCVIAGCVGVLSKQRHRHGDLRLSGGAAGRSGPRG